MSFYVSEFSEMNDSEWVTEWIEKKKNKRMSGVKWVQWVSKRISEVSERMRKANEISPMTGWTE